MYQCPWPIYQLKYSMNDKIAEGAGLGLVGHSSRPAPRYWLVVLAVVVVTAVVYLTFV